MNQLTPSLTAPKIPGPENEPCLAKSRVNVLVITAPVESRH